MKRILYIVVVTVVVISFAVWMGNEGRKETDKIVIGAALSLSGAAAQDGESIKNGIELARADLRSKGVDVEVIYQDDKTEPKDTVSAVNALAVQGVQAIIGPTWSYLADAGLPVAERLNVVSVMPANTSEYVNAKSEYAFFTTIRVEHMGPVLTTWLKESGKRSIAIIRNQGSWYETVGNIVEKAVADAGARITFFEEIPFGADAATISTVLAKVKASGADLIFFEVDDPGNILTLFKKVKEQKISADLMSVTTALGKVKGNITFDNNVYALAPKTSNEFNEKYKAVYGVDAQAYTDSSYDSLMLLVEALQNKGDMKLSVYLRNQTNYQGFAKTYNFDSNGDIVGGEWVIHKI